MVFSFVVLSILLLLVTPLSLSLRSIADTIYNYSATDINLLGFLRAMSFRLKINEDDVIKYVINRSEVKDVIPSENEEKNKNKITIKELLEIMPIDGISIDMRYGVKDNAMRTAIESFYLSNGIYIILMSLGIEVKKMNIVPDYSDEVLAIDIKVDNRLAIMQIFVIALRILMLRRKKWKISKK